MSCTLILATLIQINLIELAAHDFSDKAQYLGNEGVLFSFKGKNRTTNILFDPFFHNSYNTYTLVPEKIREDIYSESKPFDSIDAIFVSHAHGDHFSAEDGLNYLEKFPQTKLIAPKQAIDQILKLPESDKVKERLISVDLKYKQQAKRFSIGAVKVDAVRIPHAGWPQRSEVENIVFRVGVLNGVTIMHLGDADPNKLHFDPYKKLWQEKTTDLAFPPYWFYLTKDGNEILENKINAVKSIGVHVPTIVPENLKQTGKDYFSVPGESRILSDEKVK